MGASSRAVRLPDYRCSRFCSPQFAASREAMISQRVCSSGVVRVVVRSKFAHSERTVWCW
jgi:hypothetical protein